MTSIISDYILSAFLSIFGMEIAYREKVCHI